MATYTPNLNLYKPDSTDDFSDFRSEFNNNMDIIDQGGGGGTGDVADVEVNGISVVDAGTKIAEITSYEEVTLAEYESIPVAERESNGIAYFIKDLNNESVQGYPPLIYSDEEREVGVWRDGKPLYQKTIDCGALPNNATKNVNHNVSDVETIFIVNAFGINSSKESYPIPFAHRSTTVNQIQINVDSTKITLGTGGSLWTSLNGFVTIRYTKTTDTAGGGIWNGQGGYAHHYSTSEKVIGTWIDGKPIYEKTFTNVANGTQILTGVSTVVDFRVSAHGTSPNSNYHCFGDGFTINSSKIFTLINGVVTYGSWTSSTGEIEKDADFIVIQYTKTTD